MGMDENSRPEPYKLNLLEIASNHGLLTSRLKFLGVNKSLSRRANLILGSVVKHGNFAKCPNELLVLESRAFHNFTHSLEGRAANLMVNDPQ